MKLHSLLDFLFPFAPFLRSVQLKEKRGSLLVLLTQILPFTFFIHWLASFVPYLALLYLLFGSYLAANRHNQLLDTSKKSEIYENYLWYLVIVIGAFGNLRSFIGHVFLSDYIAQLIGWASESPFQLELGFFQLGIALASMYCIWHRKNLTQGLAITLSVFMLGAAYVHIRDIVLFANYSPFNVGQVLVGDIVVPIMLLHFFFKARKGS